jgi:hypothetical protein
MRNVAAAVALAIAGAAIGLDASDRVGIYAVVDRIVFEPTAENPERVQIWGAFAVATPGNRDDYDAVQRGYLYFAAVTSNRMTRAEWNDLKDLAGSRRIVGFSSRFGQSVRVRGSSEKPVAPDPYVLGVGVNLMQPDRDYAPIKALAAHISR